MSAGKYLAVQRGAFEIPLPEAIPTSKKSLQVEATAPMIEWLTVQQIAALMEWRWTLPVRW